MPKLWSEGKTPRNFGSDDNAKASQPNVKVQIAKLNFAKLNQELSSNNNSSSSNNNNSNSNSNNSNKNARSASVANQDSALLNRIPEQEQTYAQFISQGHHSSLNQASASETPAHRGGYALDSPRNAASPFQQLQGMGNSVANKVSKFAARFARHEYVAKNAYPFKMHRRTRR